MLKVTCTRNSLSLCSNWILCICLYVCIVDEIKELKAANAAEQLVKQLEKEREKNRILTEKLHEKESGSLSTKSPRYVNKLLITYVCFLNWNLKLIIWLVFPTLRKMLTLYCMMYQIWCISINRVWQMWSQITTGNQNILTDDLCLYYYFSKVIP